MKKAVISTGGKQYLVSEGDKVETELIKSGEKSTTFSPLLVLDGEKTTVGKPQLKGVKVTADIVDPEVKADKVTAIRYKAKKRVKKVRGHRQRHSIIEIKKIG